MDSMMTCEALFSFFGNKSFQRQNKTVNQILHCHANIPIISTLVFYCSVFSPPDLTSMWYCGERLSGFQIVKRLL